MLLPPFWRGRLSRAPAGIRLSQFHAVLKAAQALPAYREHFALAGLESPETIDSVTGIEEVLARFAPISWLQYTSLFNHRELSHRRQPSSSETRSALLVPYTEACSGNAAVKATPVGSNDLYSDAGVLRATADLFRLSRALNPGKGAASAAPKPDMAVVVFSGMDAGILTEAQRDQIWAYYQVPLFEQLIGTDGKVLARECEVHAGLHISPAAAILECVDNEIVLTSLTDTEHPAIRVRTGLMGAIDPAPCECGRVEARVIGLKRSVQDLSAAAVA